MAAPRATAASADGPTGLDAEAVTRLRGLTTGAPAGALRALARSFLANAEALVARIEEAA